MSENNKNLSRRDALKVLGAAAGAVALANLPEKWSSPELESGVLPAHAQTSDIPTPDPTPDPTPTDPNPETCTDWNVYIEVLSGYFAYDVIQSPAPDYINGDGGPGSIYAWNSCQTGCLFLWLDLAEISTSGSVSITTLGVSTTISYSSDDPLRDIVIEMATGAISILAAGVGGSAGSCVFPLEAPAAASQQNSSILTRRTNAWK